MCIYISDYICYMYIPNYTYKFHTNIFVLFCLDETSFFSFFSKEKQTYATQVVVRDLTGKNTQVYV